MSVVIGYHVLTLGRPELRGMVGCVPAGQDQCLLGDQQEGAGGHQGTAAQQGPRNGGTRGAPPSGSQGVAGPSHSTPLAPPQTPLPPPPLPPPRFTMALHWLTLEV